MPAAISPTGRTRITRASCSRSICRSPLPVDRAASPRATASTTVSPARSARSTHAICRDCERARRGDRGAAQQRPRRAGNICRRRVAGRARERYRRQAQGVVSLWSETSGKALEVRAGGCRRSPTRPCCSCGGGLGRRVRVDASIAVGTARHSRSARGGAADPRARDRRRRPVVRCPASSTRACAIPRRGR